MPGSGGSLCGSRDGEPCQFSVTLAAPLPVRQTIRAGTRHPWRPSRGASRPSSATAGEVKRTVSPPPELRARPHPWKPLHIRFLRRAHEINHNLIRHADDVVLLEFTGLQFPHGIVGQRGEGGKDLCFILAVHGYHKINATIRSISAVSRGRPAEMMANPPITTYRAPRWLSSRQRATRSASAGGRGSSSSGSGFGQTFASSIRPPLRGS